MQKTPSDRRVFSCYASAMMKPQTIIGSVVVLAVFGAVAFALGMQPQYAMESVQPDTPPDTQASSSEPVEQWIPEAEPTEDYEAAERESKRNVERAAQIANAFVYEGVPEGYVEFCANDAGFCFSHPASWGEPRWQMEQECIGRPDLVGFIGKFGGMGENYFFGASPYTYAGTDECETSGRGLGLTDELADPRDADTIIRSEHGADVAVWHGTEVGWETHEYDLTFTAPTTHPLATRIIFVGPATSDPALSEQDIHDVLIAAHSYRTIPVEQ